MREIIPTSCICPCSCGVNVHVENGEVVKLTGIPGHPINKGRLCPKGASAVEFYYRSPDRIKYPMRNVNGVLKRISWDEALEFIAEKLHDIKEKYGPESLAVLRGMQAGANEQIGVLMMRRFMDAYGTPNWFTVDNQCFFPHMMAYVLTLGRLYRADGNLSKVGLRILWGRNVDECAPMDAMAIRKARKQGLKLIVVDPRQTPLAKEADLFIQLRPGTDAALALGMLNVIISKQLYDKEFVAGFTNGFDKLVEHVKAYPPEVVEKITLVPAAKIIELAETFATVKPASINHSYNVIDQQAAGFHAARAICILQAITGNIDVPGGFVQAPVIFNSCQRNVRYKRNVTAKPLGWDEFPLTYHVYGREIGEGQGNLIPETIMTGSPYPIKGMIVIGSNPLRSWANPPKWKEALSKLDLLVVHSLFPSTTTEIADLVLPAASAFEINDIVTYSLMYEINYMMPRRKTVEFGEVRSCAEFALDLAKKMGYGDDFPWKDTLEFLNWYMEPSGFTFDSMVKEHPEGCYYDSMTYNRYKKSGFSTPSRKIEIYSEEMSKYGYEPLPVYIEPTESPVSSPELAKEYPLVLTTGKRIKEALQTEMYNVPKLGQRAAEKYTAEIHPDTAKIYNISQGDMIQVESPRGSIKIKAQLTEGILPGVVCVPRGKADTDVNSLVCFRRGNSITGVPEYKALLCKVSKAES